MADTFKKKAVESPPVDNWKNVQVEKESTVKQKSTVTYAQLEQQKANQEAQKKSCDDRIAEIVAEMAKVKSAVEA